MSVVAHLYRYPVKGLSAEALAAVDLQPGQGIPFDRAFALALSTARTDASRNAWLAKSNFVTLVEHERLAALDARFDAETGVLAIHRGGKQVARGAIGTPIGRAMIEDFFRAFLKNELSAPPHIVGAGHGPMLSDYPDPGLSIIGLASIADIERVVGQPVDPLRFRANVYLAGTAPWEEFAWIGREIRLGGARLRVIQRIARCAATNVDPATGHRDLTIPCSLRSAFGHADCGVLATVTAGGAVVPGNPAGPDER